MLSQTSEYALRAVLHLGGPGGGGPMKIDEIAGALGAPRNYLSKTLHQLVRAGVLASERGPHGGFRLARGAGELTLAEVVAPFESGTLARRCLLDGGECSDARPCAAHGRWKWIAEPMRAFFDQTTVADLLAGETRVPQPLRAVMG